MVECSGAEELLPVKAGSLGVEVGGGPCVVCFMDIFVFGEGEMLFRDSVFEGDDAGRAHLGLIEASEAEHCSYVLLILRADFFHGLAVGEVVGAVRKSDAALEQI